MKTGLDRARSIADEWISEILKAWWASFRVFQGKAADIDGKMIESEDDLIRHCLEDWPVVMVYKETAYPFGMAPFQHEIAYVIMTKKRPPIVRLIGGADSDCNSPTPARVEIRAYGTPWQEVLIDDEDTRAALEWYAFIMLWYKDEMGGEQ